MNSRLSIALAAAFVILFHSSQLSHAEASDPAAQARLQALAAAYKSLPAYVDEGAVEVEVKVAGASKVEKTATPVTFVRPNILKVSTPLVQITSDGKVVITSVPALKKFIKAPAPSNLTHNDLTEGPLGSYERGGPIGMPLRILLTLLLDENPATALQRDATGFALEKPTKIENVTYEGLRIESDTAPTVVLWIHPTTKLVAIMDVKLAESATAESTVPDVAVSYGSFRWKAGTLSTKAPAGFEAKPASDMKEVVGLDKTEAKKSQHVLVGKPAPEATLNLLEKNGKTRRTTLKDLEGKVVLIDFWAMWCGPCRKEMPDIAKLSEELAKANKPVVIVALSIDQPEEADLKALEQKVRADITSMGFDIEKAQTRLLALDPSGTVARAFGVSAIPSLVLIDAKGLVQAVHVGVTEREILAAEIEAVLAGKAVPSN